MSSYKFFGWLAIGLGIVGNPWSIGWLFGTGGTIESTAFIVGIIGLQAMLIGFGFLCLKFAQWRITGVLVNLFMAGIMVILMLFGLDLMLGTVGFPRARPVQVTHPPNVEYAVNNLEYSYIFKTNSQGIRYREIPRHKPPNTIRIVVIGDSYTEGAGVAAEETFLSQAEGLLRAPDTQIELINCGLSGTSTLNHARILFHVCINYEPDAVLLAFHTNDITEAAPDVVLENGKISLDAIAETRVGLWGVWHALWPRLIVIGEQAQQGWLTRMQPTGTGVTADVLEQKPSTETKNQNETIAESNDKSKAESDMVQQVIAEARQRGTISEVEIQAWIDSLPAKLVAAADQQRFNGYMLASGLLNPTYWRDSLNIDSPEAAAKYGAVSSVLNEIADRLAAVEIPFGVVFLPSPIQFDARYGDVWQETGTFVDQAWTQTPTELEARMKAWTSERDLPYLDLTPRYRMLVQQQPDGVWYYPLDGHLTKAGHEKAAAWISGWLPMWALPE